MASLEPNVTIIETKISKSTSTEDPDWKSNLSSRCQASSNNSKTEMSETDDEDDEEESIMSVVDGDVDCVANDTEKEDTSAVPPPVAEVITNLTIIGDTQAVSTYGGSSTVLSQKGSSPVKKKSG